MSARRVKSRRAVASVALALVFLGCGYLLLSATSAQPCGTSALNRAEWVRGADTTDGTATARFRIARRLVACEHLIGRNSRAVREILRPAKQSRQRRQATYSLGTVHGVFPEEVFLTIAWHDHVITSAEIGG